MRSNLDVCWAVTLKEEGGLSTDKADPGGTTKYGISHRAYPGLNIPALTVAQARSIFQADYFEPCGAASMPYGLDCSVADCAFNSGVAEAKRLYAGLKVTRDVPTAIRYFADARLSFLHGLRTWKVFAHDWSGRVARVEAASLVMAGADHATVQGHADGSQAKASGHLKKAGGVLVGTAATSAAAAHHLPWWLDLILLGLALAGVLIFLIKHSQQSTRADTLQTAATNLKSGLVTSPAPPAAPKPVAAPAPVQAPTKVPSK